MIEGGSTGGIPRRVTALLIDGNSISLAAGSLAGRTVRAEAFAHLELERLVEVTKRLRHPIYMDASLSFFPGKDLIAGHLASLLQQEEFRNPVVAVLAPEKIRVAEADVAAEEGAMLKERHALLSFLLPKNPFHYPCGIIIQEKPLPGDRVRVGVVRFGLGAYLPLQELVTNAGGEFLGCSSGLAASAHIIRLLPPPRKTEPVTICDIGKLRTLYTTLLPGGEVIYNAIPVGLARDDQHYFKCISPVTGKLSELCGQVGTLLFSPGTSSTPLFSDYSTSAQVDCTRLAVQVSRFATRSFEANIRGRRPDGSWQGIHYLSGRGSRLPGLRSYMEASLNSPLRRIDRRPLARVDLAENCRWAEVGDNLLAMGAVMEMLSPHPLTTGIIPHEFRSPPLRNQCCSVRALEPSCLYVFERKVVLEP